MKNKLVWMHVFFLFKVFAKTVFSACILFTKYCRAWLVGSLGKYTCLLKTQQHVICNPSVQLKEDSFYEINYYSRWFCPHIFIDSLVLISTNKFFVNFRWPSDYATDINAQNPLGFTEDSSLYLSSSPPPFWYVWVNK